MVLPKSAASVETVAKLAEFGSARRFKTPCR